MRAAILAALCSPAVLGLVIQDPNQIVIPQGAEVVPEGFSVNLEEMRLVQFEGESPVWISELDKITAKAQGKKFFDVTDAPEFGNNLKSLESKEFPAPNATAQVKDVIRKLSTDGPRENLKKFTSFRTRYYKSETGRQSQLWLLSKIKEVTAAWAPESLQEIISVEEFKHDWGQNSILVKIAGSNPSDEGAVIITAHQDSTNMWPFLPAPGADDDGSGTVTILETYRALIASNFTPTEDVWFHWYSAEEGGLLGSQAVAKDFAARGVKVKAQTQYDMTAYVKKGTREEIGIINDYVDPSLTKFVTKLVDKYLSIPYVETQCGYACSDHASWGKAGYRSSFAIESSFPNSNHYIHSSNDVIDLPEFSFDHMLEFSKLAVAFAIELAGWEET
ncbi:Leucine aminopeptidase 1 [Tulasnella sp. JGI-2019a]|nr:Leucine aminopeptidase 1 [Tulasnella sp. JGI-2019a]KAG9009911.1 Leucine aminopeptidase 1 [Tulasnella sp. JGI-2019a]KAG9034699.1 Leucine aminopeptidase 1 [Tulasnella sp. JGI-2019a]